MKKIGSFLLMFAGGVLGVCATAFATTCTGSGCLPNPLGDGTTAQGVVTEIINFVFVLTTPICALMVLWGGFNIMTSAGDPEKYKTGVNTIIYAAVGFLVVLLANSVAPVIQNVIK